VSPCQGCCPNQEGRSWLRCAGSCRDGGRVFAIVRGTSDEQAKGRLRGGFKTGDSELLALYDSLSHKHLTVLSGAFQHTSYSLNVDLT
jgi:thioester reductase-like protein